MANNDMNFLADLIPSAVIKVVTIETKGGLIELETNPHIVEDMGIFICSRFVKKV